MEYTALPHQALSGSRLILGTAWMQPDQLEKHFATLDAAWDLGINVLDTARDYGKSEEVVGQWLQQRGLRDRVILLTKCCHPYDDGPRVTPEAIREDLATSLAALNTDHVDIYLLHRDDPTQPVGPIVEAFNEHLAAGRIRAYGGSNWTAHRLEEANEYAYAHNLVPMEYSSPHFSLAEQNNALYAPGCIAISGPEGRQEREWYQKTQMPVLAYAALAHGFFSGRITRERFDQEPDTIDPICRIGYCSEDNFRRLERCTQMAQEKGVTVPQLALAYALSTAMNVSPVISASSRTHMESSIQALSIRLTAAEAAYLDLESNVKP